MADLNSVNIIGRLTRDADLKYTAGGMAVSNFSIAVNRRKKSGDQWVDEVSFFDVNFFGKAAETLKQYLLKGKQVGICGELRQDRWEKDGQTHSRVYIVANDLQLLGGNSGGNGNGGGSYGGNGGVQHNAGYASSSNGGYGQNSSFVPRNESQEYDPGSSYSDASFPEDIPF